MNPFIIYALPRSRTAWLAHFLSYGPWTVTQDYSIFMRTVADIAAYFATPFTGSVETAAAPGYWLLRYHVPTLREAIVRRPVEDVFQSLMAVELGEFRYEEGTLRPMVEYLDRTLDRLTWPGALVLKYDDLDTEAGCQRLFEHCLDRPFDREWWLKWRDIVVTVDMPKMLRYRHAHRPEIMAFKRACKSELRRLARSGLLEPI